jgi:hypothetical protein
VATSVMYPPLEATAADVFVENSFDYISSFHSFLATTALRPFLGDHEKYRRFVLGNLHGVPELGVEHRPALIYAHITVPHPPFVFDAEGRPVGEHLPLAFNDADWLIGKGVLPDEYIRSYADQVQFISHESLKTIKRILERDTSDPYIILMGDHGSRLFYGNRKGEPQELLTACANLLAVRPPGGVKVPDEAVSCPINLMRFIISQIKGSSFEPLPARVFLSYPEHPYVFEDVSRRVRDRLYTTPPPVNGF